jgi:cytochrome P450
MTNEVSDVASAAGEINFFDATTNDCPYEAYQVLRDEAPVWKDPVTGMFTLTRYEDIRMVLLDTKRFSNAVGSGAGDTGKAVAPDDPAKARELLEAMEVEKELTKLYEEKGWLPVSSLDGLDEPRHMQLRKTMEYAFRPARVRELDPYVESLAYRLIDDFIADGRCEFVSQFAVPLPLYVIGRQMGVPESDMPRIKTWTDAWIKRMGLMLNREERIWSAEQEIEAQHYFQPRFERLRRTPEDNLLSDLVNNEVPEWGRPLNDNELHTEMMADLFVGGSETSTNALSGGVMLLCRHPDVWEKVRSDPDKYLETLVEEVLRLESPVQGLLRQTTEAVDLHGVTIAAGSVIKLGYGAGNRDERRYGCPADFNLDREQPRTHLAFGVGAHHCLGAPLARRELYFGFKALVDRLQDIRFVEGANDFSFHPNYFLRSLKELHIEFTPAA